MVAGVGTGGVRPETLCVRWQKLQPDASFANRIRDYMATGAKPPLSWDVLMPAFKTPDFNERTAAARAAKQKALKQYRERPEPDPAVVAERRAAREAQEALQAERQAAKLAAKELAKAAEAQAKADAEAAALAEAEAAKARMPKVPTAAELKAARDARYAARKARS